jgi:hypothetical protein
MFASAAALLVVISVQATPASDDRPALGGRDPFAPFLHRAAVDDSCKDADTAGNIGCAVLEDLTLRAIVTATATPRAMFEDKAGRSHVIRVGDVVSGMRVIAVRRGVVVLERRLLNAHGFTSKSEVVLRLS